MTNKNMSTNESLIENVEVLLALILGTFLIIMFYVMKWSNKTHEKQQTKNKMQEVKQQQHTVKKDTVSATAKSKKKTSEGRWTGRSEKNTYSHSWCLTSLKGHTGQILDVDISNNEKYLASCADDRTVLLWCTKDLTQKEHKSLRINIDFDYATHVKWSPDSKAFIIHKATENCAEVYKVDKRKDGWFGAATKAITFPKAFDDDTVGIGIACTGKYMMTCSAKTDLILWDLKGQQLAKLDTYLMSTYCAKISPCGRFVVASGFAPDVRVWEVVFSKSGEFQSAKRAFELTGHTSGIYDVAFTPDTSNMATVSKDGTWKVYNTKVEYHKGEDPHLVMNGKYEQCAIPPKIAITPNAEVVVIAIGNGVCFFSVLTGELDKTIEGIFTGPITFLAFDSLGKYLFVAGDRHIRVFHNVTGYRTSIQSARSKLAQSQTSAMKERLETIVRESQQFLKSLNENE